MARSKKTRRGSSVVEAALILVVFLAMLMGAFDLGQVLFLHQTLGERVRSAVRYAAVREYDAAAIQNMVLYNTPVAPSDSAYGFMGLTRDMIVVNRLDAGTNEDRIVIRIQNYRFQFLSVFIPGVKTGQPIEISLPFEVVT